MDCLMALVCIVAFKKAKKSIELTRNNTIYIYMEENGKCSRWKVVCWHCVLWVNSEHNVNILLLIYVVEQPAITSLFEICTLL